MSTRPFEVCPCELVVAGAYRYIRNPMVVAGSTQGVAVGLFAGSIATIVPKCDDGFPG